MPKSNWDPAKGKHFPYLPSLLDDPELDQQIAEHKANKEAAKSLMEAALPINNTWVTYTLTWTLPIPPPIPKVDEWVGDWTEGKTWAEVEAYTAPTTKLLELEIDMAKSSTKSTKSAPKTIKMVKAAPIFQWTFTSAHEAHGVRAVYSTLLRADNTITCNCPGWVFKKKGHKERFCKHTEKIAVEAISIYKKYKKGEPLPVVDQPTFDAATMGNPKISAGLKYGRVLQLD